MTTLKKTLRLFDKDMLVIVTKNSKMIDSGTCEELLKQYKDYLDRKVEYASAVCFTTDYDVSLVIEIGGAESW